LAVPGSQLRFHVHSATEDMRVSSVREPWTIEWLRSLPPGAVLWDVGANIGITALVAAERSDRSVRVVAVEPFPANFSSLVKNIVLNHLQDCVVALPFGVGIETRMMPYHWATQEPGGALHSFGSMVRPRTGQRLKAVAHHDCMCWRLDEIVQFPGLPFPTHLKIDIDGGELDVLEGGACALSDERCQGVQIEVTDDGGGRTAAVIERLEAAGLQLLGQHPHDFPGIRDLQFIRRVARKRGIL
jgi:FkbM family methyltransferase